MSDIVGSIERKYDVTELNDDGSIRKLLAISLSCDKL